MTVIDPIKVTEARGRFTAKRTALDRGTKAAEALLWFNEHALKDRRPKVEALDGKPMVRIVASSTPHADVAQDYVTRAALTFRTAILEKAIEMAQADFDRENARD